MFLPHINAKNCHEVTKKSGSNFKIAFSFLPKDKAEALSKLYAFFRILDDCVDESDNPAEQKQALDFWRAQLISIYHGNPDHPVAIELGEVTARYQIPEDYFLELIAGCETDITKNRYKHFDELYDYCYRVASLVGLSCLKVFEYQSPRSEKMAVDLGIALQLTNIIRDVKDDLKRDRIYLPLDLMAQFDYSEQDLIGQVANQNFVNMMEELSRRAGLYYLTAFQEFQKDQENKLVAAKIMAKVYHALLLKMKKKHYPVFRKKVKLSFFKKVSLLVPFLLNRRDRS